MCVELRRTLQGHPSRTIPPYQNRTADRALQTVQPSRERPNLAYILPKLFTGCCPARSAQRCPESTIRLVLLQSDQLAVETEYTELFRLTDVDNRTFCRSVTQNFYSHSTPPSLEQHILVVWYQSRAAKSCKRPSRRISPQVFSRKCFSCFVQDRVPDCESLHLPRAIQAAKIRSDEKDD